MSTRLFTVLCLCTGNSTRSIMAEAIVNYLVPARFRAYRARSHPQGTGHPYALDTLRHFQYHTHRLRSKSWEELTGRDAPRIDVVITLCDGAANEPCPLWLGHPVTFHWGLPDPAAVEGNAEATRLAFLETFESLQPRLASWIPLLNAAVDRLIQSP